MIVWLQFGRSYVGHVGISSLKEGKLSRLIGGLVIGIAPLGIAGLSVLKHIPSGPLVGYFVLILAIGITSKDDV